MKRRALIIYCDNTSPKRLVGPPMDKENYFAYLTSSLGGSWYDNEILPLHNPYPCDVSQAINGFMNDADYTLIIFSGHGAHEINTNQQLLELQGGDILISQLKTNAPRQTIIIDSCRVLYSAKREDLKKYALLDESKLSVGSTRTLFEQMLLETDEGLSVTMFSCSKNQSSGDSTEGGYYLLALLQVANEWSENEPFQKCLDLRAAHQLASEYIARNYLTTQTPELLPEKRSKYFPFAVKLTLLHRMGM